MSNDRQLIASDVSRSNGPEHAPDIGRKTEWRPGVSENLGYYVYLLADPRDRQVFYVGKGRGSRCFSHIWEARKTSRDSKGEYEKLTTIRAVEDAGMRVDIEILRHGLSEEEAFTLEAATMDLLGFSDLTNRVIGHGTRVRGRMGVDDVNAQYGARSIEILPEHKVILIRVPRRFHKGMAEEDLYEATRKWWRMGSRRKKAEYAMAVHGGVVRAVYRIDGWIEPSADDIASDPNRVGRHGFFGHADSELSDHYLFTDVSGFWKQGNQTPYRYVNF